MSGTYTAIVRQRCTICTADSKVTVYRSGMADTAIPVAEIQDRYCIADSRETKIRFAEGMMNFLAAYDGPLHEHILWPFLDAQNRDTGISLHQFPWVRRCYLGTSQGFFPVELKYRDEAFEISVYSPWLESQKIAVIRQGKKFEGGFTYQIQVAQSLQEPFLAAIFSLPFTIPDVW